MSEESQNVRTFSAGFEETEESDKYNRDFHLARRTAAHFGTAHHEYRFTARDVLDKLPAAIWHMDEPVSNHIQTITMLLARAVAPEATVVLGGDGGDELFGGYERHYYLYLMDRLRRLPEMARNNFFAAALARAFKAYEFYRLCNENDVVRRYLYFFAQKENIIATFLRQSVNRPGVLEKRFVEIYASDLGREGERDFTRRAMRLDVRSWLADESLARSDKMTMAASIEQRVPFLDHRLVEFADRIPVRYKIGSKGLYFASVGRHYEGKVILKSAMKKYLPPWVLGRDKWGWFSPAAKWIRGPLLPLFQEVLSPSYIPETKDMLDFSALQKMLEGHVSKKKYALTPLWAALTFQLWYKEFMNK